MILKYVKAKKATIKGPFIHIDKKGNSYGLRQGEETEVPDDVGYKILQEMSGYIEKVEKPVKKKKVSKKKADPAPVNKMVDEAPNNKDILDGIIS